MRRPYLAGLAAIIVACSGPSQEIIDPIAETTTLSEVVPILMGFWTEGHAGIGAPGSFHPIGYMIDGAAIRSSVNRTLENQGITPQPDDAILTQLNGEDAPHAEMSTFIQTLAKATASFARSGDTTCKTCPSITFPITSTQKPLLVIISVEAANGGSLASATGAFHLNSNGQYVSHAFRAYNFGQMTTERYSDDLNHILSDLLAKKPKPDAAP